MRAFLPNSIWLGLDRFLSSKHTRKTLIAIYLTYTASATFKKRVLGCFLGPNSISQEPDIGRTWLTTHFNRKTHIPISVSYNVYQLDHQKWLKMRFFVLGCLYFGTQFPHWYSQFHQPYLASTNHLYMNTSPEQKRHHYLTLLSSHFEISAPLNKRLPWKIFLMLKRKTCQFDSKL